MQEKLEEKKRVKNRDSGDLHKTVKMVVTDANCFTLTFRERSGKARNS